MAADSRWSALALLGVLLSTACSGGSDNGTGAGGQASAGSGGSSSAGAPGSSGNGNAGGGSAGSTSAGAPGGFSECVDTPSDIEVDEVTPLEFSAADVVTTVGGTHELDLLWMGSDLYASHARSGMVTPLTLVFGDVPVAARYIDSQGGGCVGGDGPCIVCMGRVELDIDLQLTSGDGALDEQLTVTLEAASKDAPTLSVNVAEAALGGQYLAEVTPKPDYSLTGLHLEAGYGVGFSGSHSTVPDAWNGFVAATVRAAGSTSDVMQAHGYFPKETGM